MRDIGLFKAFFVVTLFWYSVAMLANFGAMGLVMIPTTLLNILVFPVIGLIIGVGVVGLYRWINDASIRVSHKPSVFRGMSLNIGVFPCGKRPPVGFDRKMGDIFLTEKLNKWFVGYSKENPLHAALFKVAAGIYAEHGDIPASPVPGGHGGASLRQHSENVLMEMMELAPGWNYIGHTGKSGKVLVHPLDGTWIYKDKLADSPILPLMAYLHDIGKVECYKLKDGFVKEVQKNHDTVGKRILIRINEYWELPVDDREILAMAIGYYHHIGSLPLWCNDAVRAASELLIHVDIATGLKEGGDMNDFEDYAAGDPTLQFGAKTGSAPVITIEKLAEELGITQDEYTKNESCINSGENVIIVDNLAACAISAPNIVNFNKNKPATTEQMVQSEWMYGLFSEIITEPGFINGTQSKRIGFKRKGWVYVNDQSWRKEVAKRVGNDSISKNETGQISEASFFLLEELKKRGALLTNFNGAEYSTKKALYTVEFYLPKRKSDDVKMGVRGSLNYTWPFTLVFKADLFPQLAALTDCDGEIEIIKSGWGASAATNKAGINLPVAVVKTPGAEIFINLREQHKTGGVSDIPFQIDTCEGKTYQCIRLDLLNIAYPTVEWCKEKGLRANDKDGNKMLLIEIMEQI